MVTSGAVAFGKQKLAHEVLMSLSMRETLSPKDPAHETVIEPRAAAAVGQSGILVVQRYCTSYLSCIKYVTVNFDFYFCRFNVIVRCNVCSIWCQSGASTRNKA